MIKFDRGQIWTSADREEALMINTVDDDLIVANGWLCGRVAQAHFSKDQFRYQFPVLLWMPPEEPEA